jgi:hypothetical protein
MHAIIKQVAAMNLLGVAALIHSHDAAAALPTPECTKLYAGKSTEAGTICVTNDLESLYVTYSTTGDWYLDDVHPFVGATLATMPVTKTGNPKIGNFPYVVENLNTQMYTFTVPLGDFGAADPCVSPKKIAIAAHAALIRRDTAGVIYQTETGWANGTQLNIKGSWAMYFEYTTRCPPQNGPVTYSCETAFAFGDQTFADLGNIRNARWGWQITVDQSTSGYMTPIYAGAAGRAVDQGGDVIDMYLQSRRDAEAAKRFFRRLFRSHGTSPRKIVTDKLGSHGVARRKLMPETIHRTDRHADNRAYLSQQPTRAGERGMRRFSSPMQAQRFLSAHAVVHSLFSLQRHLASAAFHRLRRARAFKCWNEAVAA